MANATYQALKNANVLPSPTGVALELLRLAGDHKATLDAIAKVVEADPAVAGRMLKLVNSSLAGVSRKVASIPVAVRLLGLRTVKSLALGISLVSNHRKGRCDSFNYERFWSESFGRAVAARRIADRCTDMPADEAFAAGLFAKIGCLALATAYPEEYARVLDAGRNAPGELSGRERTTFGIDHNELSAEMLADWRIEQAICQAVRCQGALNGPTDGAQGDELARLLHLAGATASVLVQARTDVDTIAILVAEAGRMDIPRDTFSPLFDSISNEWQEAGSIFSVSTRDMPSLEELQAQAQADRDESDPGGALPLKDITQAGSGTDALRILVVDDDPAMLRLLARHLTTAGHQVVTATNGMEALEVDRVEAVQMILTDWTMPRMDGIELCRRLRSCENRGFVYVIVLTAKSESTRVIEALDAGADDFLIKPFDREALLAHVRAGERIVRLEAHLAERSREVSLYNTRLAAANEKLRALATTDELTGLSNRRQGMERLAEYWPLAARHDEPLSCIIADVDHFKRFNDTYGHAVGDTILKAIAKIMRTTVRAGEMVCRLGGEEFLIICPKSGVSAAQHAAERIHQAIASTPVKSDGNEWSVTVSLGVAERKAFMRSPQDLLKAADEMLYAAKQAGRNRVCVAGAHSEPAPLEQEAPRQAEPKISPKPEQPTPPPANELPNQPVSVLIVDDDPQARALSRRMLEREGYSVCEASNGVEALESIPACLPDVIVLDSRMPILDGLECARRLKTQTGTQDIPIIMLSAAGEAKDIEAGLEAGVDEYITKPFRAREFALRVRSMARLQRSKAELIWSNQRCWEQARTLQVLLDLSVGLAASDDLDTILSKAVAAAAELTHCRRISVMLPDAQGAHLTIARHIGIDDKMAAAVRVPVGKAIAGQVFASGRQIVVNYPEEIEQRRNRYDAGFFVSAPLISKALRATRRVVGVINITDRLTQRPFEPSELELLDLLCNIAATAIDDLLSRQERDEAQDSIVGALATLAEYRDADTASHLDRVTRYAVMLARSLRDTGQYKGQVDRAFVHCLRRAMPLHDIGKVGVPDNILLKPGKLTAAEMEQMKRHAEDGARTIRAIRERMPAVEFLQMAEDIAWSHHERWDGMGYPRGLARTDIPLSARIAAVADVYDALTTRRVYKEPVSHETAIDILRRDAGSHFDPIIIDTMMTRESDFARVALAFADTIAEGKLAKMAGTR